MICVDTLYPQHFYQWLASQLTALGIVIFTVLIYNPEKQGEGDNLGPFLLERRNTLK